MATLKTNSRMGRCIVICVALWVGLATLTGYAAGKSDTPGAKIKPVSIIKTLPHLLDLQGRHAESPSLYDRDAYQAYLREHPNEVSALRFDVQWKAKVNHREGYTLKIETRGSKLDISKVAVFEEVIFPPKLLTKWSSVTLTKKQYEEVGQLLAWRVSIWDGNTQLAEQQSFLW